MDKISCIYKITNIINDKLYVGSTTDFNRRKRTHLNNLLKNKHHSIYLQNAYNKYGIENFIFEIIELCENDVLIQREQYWHDILKAEYSMMKNVQLHVGMKRSDATKQKISQANTGKTHSMETKEKLKLINQGKTLLESTKKKISDSLKSDKIFLEKLQCPERLRKIKETRLSNGGYIVSEEMKQKISKTLKSRNLQSAVSITVEQYSLDGMMIKSYPSFAKAETENNLWRGSLSHQLHTLKREKYKGFIWKILPR